MNLSIQRKDGSYEQVSAITTKLKDGTRITERSIPLPFEVCAEPWLAKTRPWYMKLFRSIARAFQ